MVGVIISDIICLMLLIGPGLALGAFMYVITHCN